jgi:hypothetical protein
MKRKQNLALWALVCGLLNGLPSGPLSLAAEATPLAAIEEACLRVRRDDRSQPQALETAVITYVPQQGPAELSVELIAAVHVGDEAYYQRLNRLFTSYDVLLYELVAPEQAAVPRPSAARGSHPVSTLQRAMKSMLDLEFQLEKIDYTKENFVHADMSPEEFSRTMKARGESFLQLYFRAVGQAMAMQSHDAAAASDIQLLTALLARDRSLRLKRVLAEQFETMGGMTLGLDGPEGSTILTERNKKALEILAEQIGAGRRKIGIFYGAAHLPDMQRRLVGDFQLQKDKVRWIKAWDLTGAKDRSIR